MKTKKTAVLLYYAGCFLSETIGKERTVQYRQAADPEKNKGTFQKVISGIRLLRFFPPSGSVRRMYALFLCITAAMSFGCAAGPIKFYQGPLNHLNAVRTGTCPMYPSCSSYAETAFEKHGPLAGSMMTFDRLIRCGRDETGHAKQIYIKGNRRYHDPVQHNDFWWYENRQKPYPSRRHE